ncbi:MAG: adenylate kinase family protein [Acidimicrobiales bacterium]
MRLILLGAPGAGKGTQAAALARRLGVAHISSGALLRSHVAARTELGREVAEYLDRGELVPDDLVTGVVADAVSAAGPGYVLEGYPRTVSQARRADVPGGGVFVDAAVSLDLPDDVARQRLAARHAGRSDDRDPEVIERRLRRFHADTEPVADYYRDRGLLVAVDAAQPAHAVTTDILAALAAIH